MATHKLQFIVEGGGVSRNVSVSHSVTGVAVIDAETVANGQTDKLVAFALDVSACKSFYIESDQAITVETNDGTTPSDTLSLAANEPYVWHDGMTDSFLLTTDVTALYVTNASGSTATIYCVAGYDATP